MESIKAQIRGAGINSSVEFTVEEVIARHHGKPWGELDATEQEAVLKDYARGLFVRQSGMDDEVDVSLGPGTLQGNA